MFGVLGPLVMFELARIIHRGHGSGIYIYIQVCMHACEAMFGVVVLSRGSGRECGIEGVWEGMWH